MLLNHTFYQVSILLALLVIRFPILAYKQRVCFLCIRLHVNVLVLNLTVR